MAFVELLCRKEVLPVRRMAVPHKGPRAETNVEELGKRDLIEKEEVGLRPSPANRLC